MRRILLALLCAAPLAMGAPVEGEPRQLPVQETQAVETVYFASMGCDLEECTDSAHYHHCPAGCTDPAHCHDCPTDCPVDRPMDCPADCPVDRPTDCPVDCPADCPTDVDDPACPYYGWRWEDGETESGAVPQPDGDLSWEGCPYGWEGHCGHGRSPARGGRRGHHGGCRY